jgi:hypothetical protein
MQAMQPLRVNFHRSHPHPPTKNTAKPRTHQIASAHDDITYSPSRSRAKIVAKPTCLHLLVRYLGSIQPQEHGPPTCVSYHPAIACFWGKVVKPLDQEAQASTSYPGTWEYCLADMHRVPAGLR